MVLVIYVAQTAGVHKQSFHCSQGKGGGVFKSLKSHGRLTLFGAD